MLTIFNYGSPVDFLEKMLFSVKMKDLWLNLLVLFLAGFFDVTVPILTQKSALYKDSLYIGAY